MNLVPESFQVPQDLKHEKFIARKLGATDVDLDFEAVMSSIDIIRKTRGGNWPSEDMTREEDWIDLAWHQREFEFGLSFAYTVMNLDQTECLGCFYFYPAGFRGEVDKDSDVDVSFWVTQKAFDDGLYDILYFALKDWIEDEWPFKKPYWSNRVIPK